MKGNSLSTPAPDSEVPKVVVGRLSLYLRELQLVLGSGKATISSSTLARRLGLNASQVRKDFAYFGQFGHPGVGYHCDELIQKIKSILGTERTWPVAMIGCGNIADMAIAGCKNENIVALCDVDSNMHLSHSKKYPEIKKARQFADFRVMLDKMGKEIDAVCINTPDHTHFAATIAAMEHGKHVFTQKPLTHNIWQARTLRKAMHKYKVTTNMGNQGHSYGGIRRLREWYEADVFGQITEVHSWIDEP